MKNRLLKFYIAAFCFCSTSILFAQPGTDDTGGGLESPDAPAAPIDDYVGILALVGLSYVLIKVRANHKPKNTIE
ncbi:hypothetical protein [Flavobacterium nackdongense]|uniref:Signal peptidase n=1 Tax=Flavobacterium nackdongense TaxID=2547394 RepID=A0A4V1AGX2_9FLAO|nr:hypothetical protein [Flavobacterium nackdongense]QBN19532.1 hypothetical protein E1750_12230 [Flavobacterium nackdongense]